MKTDIIKKLERSTPYWVKRVFAPIIRNKLIGQSGFRRTLEEIDAFNSLTEAEKITVQMDRLKETLVYAYEHTRFYGMAFKRIGFDPYRYNGKDKLSMLPIITRDEVMSNMDDFISDEKMHFYHAQTGGSTGKPFRVVLSMDSLYKEKAFIYKAWEKIGYDYRRSRLFTLRASVEFWNNERFKYNPVNNEIIVSPLQLNRQTIHDYVALLKRFKAEFIHGYPSGIRRFCQLVREEHLENQVHVKGVMFISENVFETDITFVESVLNARVVAFYGHTERSVFAERENGSYGFNKFYGFTELIPVPWDKDAYDIVCTGFLNRKMPLIRYTTGDTARFEDGVLQIGGHRELEVLIGKKSNIITLHTFNYGNELFKEFGIHTFQFVQEKPGHVWVHVMEEPICHEMMEKINKSLKMKVGTLLDFDIKVVNELVLSKTGKYKRIIQNLDTSQYLY